MLRACCRVICQRKCCECHGKWRLVTRTLLQNTVRSDWNRWMGPGLGCGRHLKRIPSTQFLPRHSRQLLAFLPQSVTANRHPSSPFPSPTPMFKTATWFASHVERANIPICIAWRHETQNGNHSLMCKRHAIWVNFFFHFFYYCFPLLCSTLFWLQNDRPPTNQWQTVSYGVNVCRCAEKKSN